MRILRRDESAFPDRGALPHGSRWRVAVTGGVQTLADRRIAQQIEEQLAYAKTFDGTCIEVHVHGEDVFLRGRLPSLHAKVEAGLLASAIRGVERVHNQIRIHKPG
jgi:osmotically-inducible protein OsmY